MDKIILIGTGGHASACIDVIEQQGRYKIAGLIESVDSRGLEFMGFPILGTDNDIESLRQVYKYALVSVGQIKSAATRIRLYDMLKSFDYQLPQIVSPLAYLSRYSQIGEGTIIMHGVVINVKAVIGNNCIINSQSLIEHDARVGDHCHIATRAVLNGAVDVHEGAFVGSGAVLKQGIEIGKNSVVGMGSIVKKDIKSMQTIIG